MKKLLLAALFSAMLLLDVDGSDDEPDEEDPDQSDRLKFIEDAEYGYHAIVVAKGRDAAADFSRVTSPADLLDPGMDENLAIIREVSPERADALEAARDAVRAEQEAEDQRIRDAEVLARKSVLAALPPNERVAEQEGDPDLIQQIVEEEYLASPEGAAEAQVDEDLDAAAEVIADLKKTGPGTPEFEEHYGRLQAVIGPARALADVVGDPERSAAERFDAWTNAAPRTKGVASELFGIREPFDVDLDSDEYRSAVEQRRKAQQDDAEWAAAQLTREVD